MFFLHATVEIELLLQRNQKSQGEVVFYTLKMAKDTCGTCTEPLYIEIDLDSDVEDSKALAKPETVPDDVEFSCGCHYHW